MSKLVYLRGLSTDLNNTSLKDGQILFTTDTYELFIDFINPETNELMRESITDTNLSQELQTHIESLNKVENKSSEEIRDELTYENVINALGYVPSIGESVALNAEGIVYDNTESGLTGENVQAALDEVVEKNAVNQVKIEYIESELENLSPNSVINITTGEDICLTDSAEGKAAEFALYGKAKQNTTQGNQLFDAKAIEKGSSDSFAVSDDEYTIQVTGTKAYAKTVVTLDAEKFAGKTIYFKADSITTTENGISNDNRAFIMYVQKY